MLISVIIPCYNVSRPTLERCLDSLSPLTALCEWEAWLIDDGSQEDWICSWVNSQDNPRLNAIRQENQGQGAARNVGINRSKGEYLVFLDADDELLFPTFSKIVELLKTNTYDAVIYRFKQPRKEWKADLICSGTAYMKAHDISGATWCYAIRRTSLGNLRFTPGIYHEDEEFNTLMLLRMKLVRVTGLVAYRYHYEPLSTIHNPDEKHLRKRFSNLASVIERLKEYPTLNDDERQAIRRRTHVLAMDYVLNIMRDSRSKHFTQECLDQLTNIGFYPLPLKRISVLYFVVSLLSHYRWQLRLIAPLVAKLLR